MCVNRMIADFLVMDTNETHGMLKTTKILGSGLG